MWKTLSEKIVHKNKWYQINKKEFEMQNKKRRSYFVLETNGASMVVPIINDEIVFVRQYRYPVNKWSIELPSGCINDGQSSLESAKMELFEETGFVAQKIKKIGEIATETGLSSEICQIFIAEDLKYVGDCPEKTEVLEVVKIKIVHINKMIKSGRIFQSLTLATLMIAQDKIFKK